MIYMKLYFDLLDALEPFGDAERGRLLTAILQYGRTGEVPQLSGNERFIFPMIRAQMDRDESEFNKKNGEISEARSAAGKKGAASKTSKQQQTQANQANVSKSKQTSANQAKDKDKDKDKDYNKDDIETPLPPFSEFSSPAMQAAFESWLAYKKERREAYKPTGLKAFVSHLNNMIEQDGEQAVIDAINYSMAQGYQGIWQEDKRRSTATKAERTKDAFDAWQPDDEPPVVWEEDA